MPLNNHENLSQETLELLSWMNARPGGNSSPFDEAMLAAFVCGVSTPEQESDTLGSLVKNRAMRKQLRELQDELNAIRATPYVNVNEKSFSPVLVHCLRGAMQASMRCYSRSRRISLERRWSDLSVARDFEAKSMRALIGSIGNTLQSAYKANRKDSDFLSIDRPQLDSSFSADTDLHFEAVIKTDGSLEVQFSFAEGSFIASSNLILELVDPNGGTIPVGDSVGKSRRRFLAPGFAEIAGLQPGPLAPGLFRLSLAGSLASAPLPGPSLYAPVEKSNSCRVFQLLEEPKIERGELLLFIRAIDELDSDMERCGLSVLLPVGNVMQLLQTWSMSGWGRSPQMLRYPLSGVVDGTIGCGSIIHIRVTPP